MSVRVYPIRMSRRSWDIPLYFNRKDDEGKDVIKRGSVSIVDFNPSSPVDVAGHGELYQADEIVIPDSIVHLRLSFPLTVKLEVDLESKGGNGFSRKELIAAIVVMYYFIYEQEEETAPLLTFPMLRKCMECEDKDLSHLLLPAAGRVLGEGGGGGELECCICYTSSPTSSPASPGDDENTWVKLGCGHHFHRSCILEWFKMKYTCPMCRAVMWTCEECDDTGMVYYEYIGTVLPSEFRETPFRNRTYGVFGIHSYDLEMLLINCISYNRETKIIEVSIGV